VSARIDENGVKTEKLGLKQGFRGLYAKDLDLKGPKTKKPGARSQLNPRKGGLARKTEG
jgi:hypothetical protein